jgi:hypothetical protein
MSGRDEPAAYRRDLKEQDKRYDRLTEIAKFKSLFKIWNFGVANAKILPCRLQKSPKTGIFVVY